MKFFSINCSDELKEIGYHPQTEIEPESFGFLSIGSTNEVRRNVLRDDNVRINLLINEKSKVTDYLYNSSITFGFVVSSRLKKIIETCSLPPHRFYPVTAIHKGQYLDYFWFHYMVDIYQHVDLMASSITIFHKFNFNIIDKIKIESIEKVKKIKSLLPFDQAMKFNEIILRKGFPGYDVFDLTGVQFIPIVSERFLDKLQKNLVTGFESQEYNQIVDLSH